jgi:hypothetical protein
MLAVSTAQDQRQGFNADLVEPADKDPEVLISQASNKGVVDILRIFIPSQIDYFFVVFDLGGALLFWFGHGELMGNGGFLSDAMGDFRLLWVGSSGHRKDLLCGLHGLSQGVHSEYL